MDEKVGEFGIFVGDNVEYFSVCDPHGELYRIGDNFTVNNDGCWRVEHFDGDKNLAIFYLEIHGVVWVKTAEFDGNWSSVVIINKFNLCGMCDESFIVCGSWLGNFVR